eukprot:696012-Hanusia_phi.AAC.2
MQKQLARIIDALKKSEEVILVLVLVLLVLVLVLVLVLITGASSTICPSTSLPSPLSPSLPPPRWHNS